MKIVQINYRIFVRCACVEWWHIEICLCMLMFLNEFYFSSLQRKRNFKTITLCAIFLFSCENLVKEQKNEESGDCGYLFWTGEEVELKEDHLQPLDTYKQVIRDISEGKTQTQLKEDPQLMVFFSCTNTDFITFAIEKTFWNASLKSSLKSCGFTAKPLMLSLPQAMSFEHEAMWASMQFYPFAFENKQNKTKYMFLIFCSNFLKICILDFDVIFFKLVFILLLMCKHS